MAEEFPPRTLSAVHIAALHCLDLLDTGQCTPQCILARGYRDGCDCSCHERHHGRLRSILHEHAEFANIPCDARDDRGELCDLWVGHDSTHARWDEQAEAEYVWP